MLDFRQTRCGTQWASRVTNGSAGMDGPSFTPSRRRCTMRTDPNAQEVAPAMADSDGTTHQVVVNDEEQYSIWPLGQDLPSGWRRAGVGGSKDDCVAWIDEHWVDMRPRSLREAMDSRG
jgi:MbtH protein